jgi:hypothetical protein
MAGTAALGAVAAEGEGAAVAGRAGKQPRLRTLGRNPNVSSAERGWDNLGLC